MSRKNIFDQLGVTLRNTQNSWGGRDADGNVAMTIWTDLFREGVYVFPTPRLAAGGHKRAGLGEHVANLKHAVEHHGGRFRAVMTVAADPRALPRKCARQWIGPWMRIIRYDESGAFEAKID